MIRFIERLLGHQKPLEEISDDVGELRRMVQEEYDRRIKAERRSAWLAVLSIVVVVASIGVQALLSKSSTEYQVASFETTANMNSVRSQAGDCFGMGMMTSQEWNEFNDWFELVKVAEPEDRKSMLHHDNLETKYSGCVGKFSACEFDPDRNRDVIESNHGLFPICDVQASSPITDDFYGLDNWSAEIGFIPIDETLGS